MDNARIIIQQFALGPMENYVYFIGCQETNEIAVVDPGWDVGFLLKEAKRTGYTISAILLTHGHPDHIEGLEKILKSCDVPVYLSEQEADFYTPECKNLKKTKDKEIIRIGKITIECIHTPGHATGCQCYHSGNILLTGDVLFISGCGRCDLPGGNPRAMYHSLYNVIMKLPDSTIIYPGHHYGDVPSAPLSELKQKNRFLTCRDIDEFLTKRMGF